MKSLLSASQLLGAFLEKEHDKISRNIKKADFAGELEKLTRNTDKTVAAPKVSKSQGEEDSGAWANLNSKTVQNVSQTKSAQSKNSADSRTRIKTLKARARNTEQLFIAKPALLEATLGGLRMPAETIKSCKNLQDKQGQISLKEFKALLEKMPEGEGKTSEPAEIPAEQVRELIGSIVTKKSKKSSDTVQDSSAAILKSVEVKTEGSYTGEELRNLLDKILQTEDVGKGITETFNDKTLPSTEIASQAVAAPKAGQVQSLTAMVLPSFTGDSEESLDGKEARELPREPVAKTTSIKESVAATGASTASREIPPGRTMNSQGRMPETALRDVSLPATEFEPVARTVEGGKAIGDPSVVEQKGVSGHTPPESPVKVAGELSPIIQTGVAREIASNPSDPERAMESAVSQVQNVSVPAKEVEKRADRFSQVEPAAGADLVEGGPQGTIAVAPTEDAAADASAYQDPDRSADLVRKMAEQARALKKTSLESPAPAEEAGAILAQSTEVEPERRAVDSGEISTEDLTADPEAAQRAETTGVAVQRASKGKAGVILSENMDIEPERIAVSPGKTSPEDQTTDPEAAQRAETTGVAVQRASKGKAGVILSENMDIEPERIAVSPGKTSPEDQTADPEEAQGTETAGIAVERVSKGKVGQKNAPVTHEAIQSAADEGVHEAGTNLPGKSIQALRAALQELGAEGITHQDLSREEVLPAGIITITRSAKAEIETKAPDQAVLNELNISEEPPLLKGNDAAIIARDIHKQATGRDIEIDGAFFHALDSGSSKGQIVLPRMENSSQNAFSYYDPYRATELVETLRENYESIARGEISLEMEPEEFGRLNVKVSARGEEISASVLTDNSPAKQALLRNSDDLRQTLQDQGLTLDKFMVDVNRQRRGSNGYSKEKKSGAKHVPVLEVEKATAGRAGARAGFISVDGAHSRLSIFA